jgi:hypothetical protein
MYAREETMPWQQRQRETGAGDESSLSDTAPIEKRQIRQFTFF